MIMVTVLIPDTRNSKLLLEKGVGGIFSGGHKVLP